MVRGGIGARLRCQAQIEDAQQGAGEAGGTVCVGVASRMSHRELLAEMPRSM